MYVCLFFFFLNYILMEKAVFLILGRAHTFCEAGSRGEVTQWRRSVFWSGVLTRNAEQGVRANRAHSLGGPKLPPPFQDEGQGCLGLCVLSVGRCFQAAPVLLWFKAPWRSSCWLAAWGPLCV